VKTAALKACHVQTCARAHVSIHKLDALQITSAA